MDAQVRMDTYLQAIEEALDTSTQWAPTPYKQVQEAMRYSLLGGGKRIRGVLVLEFCRLCGGDWHTALPFACGVEMVHAYSLIHDDLPCMDNDDMRRGKPSCHIAFGEGMALLAGDGLLTQAFITISRAQGVSAEQTVAILRTLSEAAGTEGMIGGQVLDVGGYGQDVETLTQLCKMKTGALICAAAKIGCLAGEGDETRLYAANTFAGHLGVSFQVTDDILDVEGSAALLGKPVGSDKENDKNTFASLLGVEAATALSDRLLADGLAALEVFSSQLDGFLPWLTEVLANRNK